MTLCNCDCKLHTYAICRGPQWYTLRCIHSSQRCISSRQMTDNIFEVETTALAHVACAPQESGVLLTDFAAAYPSVNHSWIFLCLRILGCLVFSVASYEVFVGTLSHTLNLREQNEDIFLWPKIYDKIVLRVVSFLQWPLTRSSMASRHCYSRRILTTWTSCSWHTVLTLTTSLLLHPNG